MKSSYPYLSGQSTLADAKARLKAQLLRRGIGLPAVAAGTLSARLVHATVTAAAGFKSVEGKGDFDIHVDGAGATTTVTVTARSSRARPSTGCSVRSPAP